MTNQTPARDRLGAHGVAERLVVPLKPGNAGRGKEPQFKTDARRSEGPGDWATYQLQTAFRNCRRRCTRKRRIGGFLPCEDDACTTAMATARSVTHRERVGRWPVLHLPDIVRVVRQTVQRQNDWRSAWDRNQGTDSELLACARFRVSLKRCRRGLGLGQAGRTPAAAYFCRNLARG
jgi:hypothetical protein